ncbi:Cut9 interacting protein Scn1 [Xylariales sp. PMI_506]|nr:Cut9 interacting protein Scn1 [Xylariales sp. PMI_506]
MASVATIPSMKARGFTVMSTRLQDQDLVSDVSIEQGVVDSNDVFLQDDTSRRIVPSFGWHPWFSYQIYDDTNPDAIQFNGSVESKIAHYDKVLAPPPSSKDPAFSIGLEDPRPLSEFIQDTRARLEKHPHSLVGEIGLDKAFRIPESWTTAAQIDRDEELTPGGREGRRLSPHRVTLEHQTAVLQAQLRLAGELNRPVSVHGVQVHGGLYNAIAACWKGHEKEVMSKREQKQAAKNSKLSLEEGEDEEARNPTFTSRPFPPRICLHSYSGPVNIMQQYLHDAVPAKVFFSFSIAINWDPDGGEKNKKTEDVIRTCPDDRILIESDLHTAGESMDQALEAICRKVCELKGWDLHKGVQHLARNWRAFIFDDEIGP